MKDSVVIHHDEDKEIEVVEQPMFRVRVRTLKGSIYSLVVNKHMTVLEVKSMIQKEYGVPEDKQHLLFYGKVLEDRKTLEECAIPPESGLQLLVRSRKPMDVSIF
jgi:Ubiquitin family